MDRPFNAITPWIKPPLKIIAKFIADNIPDCQEVFGPREITIEMKV